MPSNNESVFGSTKWSAIIALAVILGLVLWTARNSIIGGWLKSRREQGAPREKAEFERTFHASSRKMEDDSKRFFAWSKIMFDAQLDEKSQDMTGGIDPIRKDGKLRSRIESTAEYQSRLKEIGKDAIRNELIEVLSMKKKAMAGPSEGLRGANLQGYLEITDLLKELEAEGKVN